MSDSYRPSSGKSGKGTLWLMLGALALLFAAFFLFWWNSAMDLPNISVPTPVMPTPNAFDTYVSAANLRLDDKKIGFALAERHGSGDKDDHAYTLADEEKLISENAKALAALRLGLAQEYLNPPVRSFSALLPYYARFRALSRLIALEGRVRQQKGDWGGAAGSYMDGVEMGEQVPHGSVLIGELVGVAMQSIARRGIWQGIDHLNVKQAREAVRRLEKIQALHCPFSQVMQEDKWAGQAGLVEILNSRNFSSAMNGISGGTSTPIPPVASQLFFLAYSKRRIMNDYTTYMDAEIARAKQPYIAQPPPTAIPNTPIMQMLAPAFSGAKMKDVANETQNGLLMVSCALQAYFVEHHRYPASLNALVPNYVTRLPDDPFALNAPFKYRLNGNKYVLYSIGPDGKDDGGRPIDTGTARNSSPYERYFVKLESLGDVVAGVNKY